MATKVMKYTDDLSIVWGVNVNDADQSIMASLAVANSCFDNASTNQEVFLYDTIEDLQVDNAGAEMLPATTTPRTITLSHPMGDKELIVPSPFIAASLQLLEGQTAFGDDLVNIVRMRGEVNNAPDIQQP